MTSNQLALREVKNKEAQTAETHRYNLVQEALKNKELSELIRNNARNYHVNLEKNEITALANDQLNDREIAKLTETIRSNLVKELETNRHNLSEEEIQRIQAANTALGKPGKYSIAAVLAALTGLMPPDEVKRLYEGTTKVSNTNTGTSYSVPEAPNWNSPSSVTNWVRESVAYENQSDQKAMDEKQTWEKQQREIIKDTHSVDPAGYKYSGHNQFRREPRVSGHTKTQHLDTENEIPADYSNSHGPSTNSSSSNHRVLDANESPTSGIQESRHGTTSGGTDYHVSGGHVSSGTIIAPSAN